MIAKYPNWHRLGALLKYYYPVAAVAPFGILRIGSPGRQQIARTTPATSLVPFAHPAIDPVAVADGGSLQGFSRDVGQA